MSRTCVLTENVISFKFSNNPNFSLLKSWSNPATLVNSGSLSPILLKTIRNLLCKFPIIVFLDKLMGTSALLTTYGSDSLWISQRMDQIPYRSDSVWIGQRMDQIAYVSDSVWIRQRMDQIAYGSDSVWIGKRMDRIVYGLDSIWI